MKMAKSWLMLIISTMLVISLAACAGEKKDDKSEGGSADAASGKVELSFWTLGNTGYDERVKEWNAANPNIQIKVQNTGDQTAHHNNLTTALSAGSGAPDIFQLEIGFMERFITSEDKFHNLNELGAADIKGDFLDWKWQQASSKDGSFQIGLPTDIAPTVVYYRTDLMEEAGLPTDPEQFGELINSWDKFAQVAADFTAKTGKPFVDLKDLTYNSLRDQSEGQIYFNKEDGSFIGDTNPSVRKAYDFTVKGIQEGWIGNWVLWSPEWGQATNSGGFGVMMGPAWMAGNIKSNGKDSSGKWKLAQMPEGAGTWGGSFLALPKEGKHAKEAYQFISWLSSKENQLTTFKEKVLMPSLPALFEDKELLEYTDEFFSGQAIAAEFAKAASTVKPMYYGPLHDQTDTYFKEALQNVLEKKADPQAEWDAAVAKAKKLVERS